jgi:hypothetical protein
MTHETRVRKLESHVSPPVGIGSMLDEPCGWCGSRPVRLKVLMRNPETDRDYPPPVGMVGCRACNRTSFSQATVDVGAAEGWFEPGGWVYEYYRKYPRTADDIARHERHKQEAIATAKVASGGQP